MTIKIISVPIKIYSDEVPTQAAHALSFIDSSRVAYKICVQSLKGSINEAHNRILCNLIGFAIELALKAYIFSKDYSKDMQRMVANKDNGHNLESLLQIAIKKGMAPLENEKIKLISALNIYYSDSGSRYYTEKRTPEEIFFEFDPCTIGDHVRIIEKINQETEKYAKSLPRNKSKGIAQKKRI